MARFQFAGPCLPVAWKRASALTAVLVFLVTKPALAHGFEYRIATPVSPPEGFGWVFFFFAVLSVALNTLLLRVFIGSKIVRAVLVSVGFFACFFSSFLMMSILADPL